MTNNTVLGGGFPIAWEEFAGCVAGELRERWAEAKQRLQSFLGEMRRRHHHRALPFAHPPVR